MFVFGIVLPINVPDERNEERSVTKDFKDLMSRSAGSKV